jgi:hypothetical protein
MRKHEQNQALKHTLIIAGVCLVAIILTIFYPLVAGGIIALIVLISLILAIIQKRQG